MKVFLRLMRDRKGRFSALMAGSLALLLAPALWITFNWAMGWFSPRTYNDLNHQFGLWALRFLLLSLACTPARMFFGWSRVMSLRRRIGVAALFYLLAHLAFYVADLGGDLVKVMSEIVTRWYLIVGLIATLAMVALGLTSFDSMIRRMGALSWRRLHQLVHLIAALAILHFFMQSKSDVREASIMLGLWLLLEAYRLMVKSGLRGLSRLSLGALAAAPVVAFLTALLHSGWYGLVTNIPMSRVWAANFMFRVIAPAWWVLVVGLAVSGLTVMMSLRAAVPKRNPAPVA